jgi:hypothetical protein
MKKGKGNFLLILRQIKGQKVIKQEEEFRIITEKIFQPNFGA